MNAERKKWEIIRRIVFLHIKLEKWAHFHYCHGINKVFIHFNGVSVDDELARIDQVMKNMTLQNIIHDE